MNGEYDEEGQLNIHKSLHERTEEVLAVLVEEEFWKELGPELAEKFRTAAHYIAHEAAMHTIKEFEQALDRLEKVN